MLKHSRVFGYVLAALLALHSLAQTAIHWSDPSPHRTLFVTVEKNVQLEVLDWGGWESPLFFLQVAVTLLTSSTTSHRSSQLAITSTVSLGVAGVRPDSRRRMTQIAWEKMCWQ